MKKLLPVGTIVQMKKENSVLMMILGFYPQNQQQIYDYVAVIYPQGIVNDEAFFLINHDEIKKVVFMGYTDETTNKFLKRTLFE